MLDVPMVRKLARKMGHRDAAEWIDKHAALYAVGVFKGFRRVEGGER